MVFLRADAAYSHASEEFRQWCTAHGILLTTVPTEAHYKLGAVERRHAVLWEAIEIFVVDTGQPVTEELINQALAYVPMQQNTLAHTKGHTRVQWFWEPNR